MPDMDLQQIIKDKQAELAETHERARVLQREIATLQATWDIVNGAKPQLGRIRLEASARLRSSQDASELDSVRKRNPKGLIEDLVINALVVGAESLDEIEGLVNDGAQFPITRGALRTQLMHMKNDEKVVSDKPGVYRLPTKGDGLATGQSS
jgi:hypothetical protein